MRAGIVGSFHRIVGGLALGLTVLLAGSTAQAASTAFNLSPSSGGSGLLRVVLDDDVTPGSVKLTASIISGMGDLEALFFSLGGDDDLLAGLSVSGMDVAYNATGNVSSLGGGLDLNGNGSPCPCDVGVAIDGGMYPAQSTMLEISHAFLNLDISLFDPSSFGAIISGLGSDDDGGTGLAGGVGGEMTVPEPGTASLLGLGLCALAARGRQRRI